MSTSRTVPFHLRGKDWLRRSQPSNGKNGMHLHTIGEMDSPFLPPTDTSFEILFHRHPHPMYVFDRETLRLFEVNSAALEQWGYSREEFLALRVTDLCPSGDIPGLLSIFRKTRGRLSFQGRWQHCRRDGKLFDADVSAKEVELGDRAAVLAVALAHEAAPARNGHAHRQGEEKYRNLFENAIEGMFQATPEGRYITANPALARIYGYSSAEEMVEAVTDIGRQLYVDPRRRAELMRLIAERGKAEDFEYQAIRKDGGRIWVSVTARAVRDTDGKLVSYEGTVEDISDRKRSELERQVTTEIAHAASFTDNLGDLLRLIHGALKKVLYADNCYVVLCSLSTGAVRYPFFADRYDAEPVPGKFARSCAAHVYRTGQATLLTEADAQKLAERGEIEVGGRPSRSWLGVPLRAQAATIGVLVVKDYERVNVYTERDVEFLSSVADRIAFAIERKRAEEKVRESEARLRILVEQLPAALWTVDRDLRFTSALGAGLARLGLKPEEVLGKPLPEHFETTDPDFLPVAAHRRAVAGEPVTFHMEWKGGSYACHAEPLRDAGGVVQGAICTALDVTDRKQLEEQFRQAQKMEAVGRLAGGIAHDFNNLLMVIQGYGDLLAERLAADGALRRNAEQIQMAAQRAASLTQQLLAFSRKQMLAPSVLNIQAVVSDLEKILRRLIGENITLETSSDSDLWLVKADRNQIEQVVLNLVVNARDAMPHGGRLTIETSNVEMDATRSPAPGMLAPGQYVVLSVTDNGSGMDAETQAHIFEPFFTTKEQGKGTGLGLATVYGVVKQSGGYIWVYSEPGQGTSFKIYLPRIEEETATGAADLRPDVRALLAGGSEVVLLAEDETGVRELARDYLEKLGYTVIEAEDGYTALELAAMHAGPIHLLLTDVVMPGISGRELAERVARVRPEIKVLYMSGYTDQAVVHEGVLETGAVLLQKPFKLATLASKIRDILALEAAV